MSEPTNDRKKWTLMFYFASDNALAPNVVSQLKAIKDAGYQQQANVVVYFDPEPTGTPAHVFDVNAIEKLKHPGEDNIGFRSNDPFVRDLMLDRLWGNEKDRKGRRIRDRIKEVVLEGAPYDRPEPPDFRKKVSGCPPPAAIGPEPGPAQTLAAFLDFCAREPKYHADHYMLFILGHGLVVGDDIFLFDEHAATQAITLTQLGCLLEEFKGKMPPGSQFELVSFHSCSMSSIEVAFELQDTAFRMLASQGPAFVGSWPYRQILIRVFNDIKNGELDTAAGIEEMIENIFFFVLHNSTDYMLAGYSFDVALCDLRAVPAVESSLKALAAALEEGLKDEMVKNCILLAHWKSQSYWQENYTDLYDFCLCLSDYCEAFSKVTTNPKPFEELQNKCELVRDVLVQQGAGKPIVRAEYAGPDAQYSHGFSVFFPWRRPTDDRQIMGDYPNYKFNSTGWFNFLKTYWGPTVNDKDFDDRLPDSTMRPSHKNELERDVIARRHAPRPAQPQPSERAEQMAELIEDIASRMFNQEGTLNPSGALNDTDPKTVSGSSSGDACTCGSIKNYLRDTRKRDERGDEGTERVPFSPSFFR